MMRFCILTAKPLAFALFCIFVVVVVVFFSLFSPHVFSPLNI